jgi:hypothetical protein
MVEINRKSEKMGARDMELLEYIEGQAVKLKMLFGDCMRFRRW